MGKRIHYLKINLSGYQLEIVGFEHFFACCIAFYLSILLGLDRHIQAVPASVQRIWQSTASRDWLNLAHIIPVCNIPYKWQRGLII